MYNPFAIRSPGARLPSYGALRETVEEDIEVLRVIERGAAAHPSAPLAYFAFPPAKSDNDNPSHCDDSGAHDCSSNRSSSSVRSPVTFAQGSRIVAHLAARYAPLVSTLQDSNRLVALFSQPPIQLFFHQSALWALGVGVLFFDQKMERVQRDALIKPAQAIIYADLKESDMEWVRSLDMPQWEVPEDEHVIALADWAEEQEKQREAADKIIGLKKGSGETRPRVLPTSAFFHSYTGYMLLQFIVGQPVVVAFPANKTSCTVIEWLELIASSNAAHMATYPQVASDMLKVAEGAERYERALRDLQSFAVLGAAVDADLGDRFKAFGIKVAYNLYGLSEFGSVMLSVSPPMRLDTLLPVPGAAEWLVMRPATKSLGGQTLEWEAWSIVERNPKLALNVALGGINATIEPYPGEGPDQGKAALNLSDLFERIEDPKSGAITWKLIGRSSDVIVWADTLSASAVSMEARLLKSLRDRLPPETIEALQVFGLARPWTALVIQTGDQNAVRNVLQDVLDEFNKTPPAPMAIIDAERVVCLQDGLALTHKSTVRRRYNERAFESWLDSL
ncbi:AMP-dependent synthetase/ligase [Ceraceosorus bombacis]|uniref:AMP-dependent synthetase/ligase n=1 Tax=Ceraceosorus bombacis TaxID=401625 RepID=A0A0P1BFF9_9BASI|nr:AMP-dependent synthetase/ligase [Ceraceosorus bombacis]